MTLALIAIVEGRPSAPLPAALVTIRVGGARVIAARASDEPDVTRALVAHDRAVRRVARSHRAVLPLRFGVTAPDRAAVVRLVEPLDRVLEQAFDRVRDAVQFTLRIAGRPRPSRAPKDAGPGTRWLAARVAAERVPELAPLTEATAPFVRERREERRRRAGFFATAYHLVPRDAVRAWRRAVRASEPHLRVALTVTGPFPPYAFAELA